MARFLEAVRRGVKAALEAEPSKQAKQAPRFSVAGRSVRCPQCTGYRFIEGRAMLNTAGMTFIGMDWADRDAITLLCTECGHIEWFGPGAELAVSTDASQDPLSRDQ